MNREIRVLDVVALTEDIPDRGLLCGQVGTVVEDLGSGVFDVEFVDNEGRTYATLPLQSDQLRLALSARMTTRPCQLVALMLPPVIPSCSRSLI